jgi:hypothetical protein
MLSIGRLGRQSRGLAMGNRSWLGPSFSFLLLNMNSEDSGQWLTLKVDILGPVGAVVHLS